VLEKRHPYPGLAMTGIVTLFKTLAKFGINESWQIIAGIVYLFFHQRSIHQASLKRLHLAFSLVLAGLWPG
jgi:hypothetical protein